MLREVRAASLEMAKAGTDHGVVGEAVGAQLNAADGFKKFGDGHEKTRVRAARLKVNAEYTRRKNLACTNKPTE